MNRYLLALSIGILAVMAVRGLSMAQGAGSSEPKRPDIQFEVLSPWADVDPVPFRGISPRLQGLAGKKIGLFVNPKRAAMPIAESIDRRLKAMYPDVQTIVFHSVGANVNEIETKNKEIFTAWAKGLDAAIAVVGD
ncbi:MAG: hypothetical protein JW882_01425 [Deltaproteobacteria bacterium]|nr:hypothetical protein [Deltaproteobacteria bacterium]